MAAAVLTDHTVVELVAWTGEHYRLSGAKSHTELGAWIAQGNVEGFDEVPFEDVFDSAAREFGEEWIGMTLKHSEISMPIFILGNSPDDFRRRREHFKRLIPKNRLSWLCVYSNATGWHWVGVRRGSLKATLPFDPRITRGAEFDLVLLVERPLARVADHVREWTNPLGTGQGSLPLYPGPEWEAWPRFVFAGPGALRLQFAGNDVTHPPIKAGQQMLINTDEARPTIRVRNPDGTEENMWPLMKGQKYLAPIPAGEVTRIDITVTGPGPDTALLGACTQEVEGLL
jgi:hypothetical protein